MKLSEKFIRQYEIAIGYDQLIYETTIIAKIDQLSKDAQKIWLLNPDTDTWDVRAYQRQLVIDGFNTGSIPQTGELIVYWGDVTPEDIESARVYNQSKL